MSDELDPDMKAVAEQLRAAKKRIDGLIAAARAQRRQSFTAELARADELLARCNHAQDSGHPLLAAARQAVSEHRLATEARIAAVDAPAEEHTRLLATANEHQRRVIEALSAIVGTTGDDPRP